MPLLEIEKGPNFEVYRGNTSAQRLDWIPGQGGVFVLRSTYVGHIEGGCAAAIIRHWDAAARAKQTVAMFHEAWEASGMESGLRIDLTEWIKKHPGVVTEVHVLSQSKIVAMAVSVANLALSGLLKGYSKRTEFDVMCKRRGLPLNVPLPTFTPKAVGA